MYKIWQFVFGFFLRYLHCSPDVAADSPTRDLISSPFAFGHIWCNLPHSGGIFNPRRIPVCFYSHHDRPSRVCHKVMSVCRIYHCRLVFYVFRAFSFLPSKTSSCYRFNLSHVFLKSRINVRQHFITIIVSKLMNIVASSVKSNLLYGSEGWRVAKGAKIDAFQNVYFLMSILLHPYDVYNLKCK